MSVGYGEGEKKTKNGFSHSIGFGHGSDVMSSSNSTDDRGLLLVVGESFAGEVG